MGTFDIKAAQSFPRVSAAYRDQLSSNHIFLPFGGQLSDDNRWIKLVELISRRDLVLQRSHFGWR